MRSGSLDFFAADADQRALLDFLFSSTDVRVFESYSEPDQDLREFRTTDELVAAFPIGTDRFGNGTLSLTLWSPSVMDKLTIERSALDPKKCQGHTFRHTLDGGGLMHLHLGGVCGRVVTKSNFGHQSQVRAQKWETEQGVNWESLQKLSNRIQYHVRQRLAVGRVQSRPVLAKAMELAKAGYALKEMAQLPWQYELPPANE